MFHSIVFHCLGSLLFLMRMPPEEQIAEATELNFWKANGTTSHDLGPQNGGLVREITLFQVKYDNLARQFDTTKRVASLLSKRWLESFSLFGITLASELKSFQCLNNCPVSADLTPRPLPLRIAILLFGPGPLHVPDAGYQMALLQSVCLMCHDMKLSYLNGKHQNHPTNVEA